MAKTERFTPTMPIYGRLSDTITATRSAPAPGATQQPRRTMSAPQTRVADPTTERRELAEARYLLSVRTLLAQVAQVPIDQVHRLIDAGE